MTKYKTYFLHDPIANVERQIMDFDKNNIQKAIDLGMIVIGITQDDVREVVTSIDDVVEPKTATMEGFTVVLPSYVDSKVDELANVVEELVDALGIDKFRPSIFNSIKESIQKIHDESLKTIENDQKMINSSPSIVQKDKT